MAVFWARTCILVALQAGVLVEVVQASVEKDLSPECRAFLYMGTPPLGLENHSLRRICQRYNGKPRFVTLYDTIAHVPVYSAYTFKRSDGERRVDVPWMFEPQLSTISDTGEMQTFPRGYMHQNFEDSQAVLEDYENAVSYGRGLLNPDEHQADPDDKAATYTLTNVVPQVREFNIGPWKEQEHVIRRRLNNYCRGNAYVVTGITTSGHMIRRHNIDRVAIPTYMWSAYCCINYDHNAPYEERYKFPAFAHYGLNERENNQILEISVKKMEEFLKGSTFVDKNFQVFVDDCVPPLLLCLSWPTPTPSNTPPLLWDPPSHYPTLSSLLWDPPPHTPLTSVGPTSTPSNTPPLLWDPPSHRPTLAPLMWILPVFLFLVPVLLKSI